MITFFKIPKFVSLGMSVSVGVVVGTGTGVRVTVTRLWVSCGCPLELTEVLLRVRNCVHLRPMSHGLALSQSRQLDHGLGGGGHDALLRDAGKGPAVPQALQRPSEGVLS